MDHRDIIKRYYQCFRERDLDGLRAILTPDFHHVSSFGEHFDRDEMLTAIWPSVGQSWARNLSIFGGDLEYMVRYTVESSHRPEIAMAEYIRFAGKQISEIEVYVGREVPSPPRA